MRVTREEIEAAAKSPGAFQRAIAADLKRLAEEAQRGLQEHLMWIGRGWEHPLDGWRQIFRGEQGGPRD